jgi:hypothetical protein
MNSIKTDELLVAYEKENNKYLENKTNKDIQKEIVESFKHTKLTKEDKDDFIQKLVGEYRFADEIDLLHIGKFTRWIKKTGDTLVNGGFLTTIDYTDNGILLTIRTWQNKFIKILLDDCLIYQKLSLEEKLVLMTADYLDN